MADIEVIWHDCLSALKAMPENLLPWLSQVRHLSRTLDSMTQNWNLKLLHHGDFQPTLDEQVLLSEMLSSENGFHAGRPYVGRVILHQNGNQPLVLGRVVFPNATYQKFQAEIEAVGASSIGEGFLFRQPNVKRTGFKYAQLTADDPRFSEWLKMEDKPVTLHGRSSIFTLENAYPVLVSEYFFDTLPSLEG